MKLLAYLIIVVVLVVPVSIFAQPSQNQSLIGRWEGSIEGFPPSINPSRVLRIHTVAADGKAVALWVIPGSSPSQTETSADGTSVKIAVQSVKANVELTRQGDDILTGQYINSSGKAFPIKFRKANLSSEFDGDWEGPATNNPRNNRDCTNGTYRVTVKDSLITGTFDIPSRVAGAGILESFVTGEIQPDKTAVLELKPLTPSMYPSHFTGTFNGNQFHGSAPAVGTGRCGYDVDLKKR
jgi:hypothetical protein